MRAPTAESTWFSIHAATPLPGFVGLTKLPNLNVGQFVRPGKRKRQSKICSVTRPPEQARTAWGPGGGRKDPMISMA